MTYNYTGTVISVDAELSGTFSVGDSLSGSYTFESTTAARTGSTSQFAVFDALSSASYTVASYTATSTAAPEIQVDDVMNADRYGVISRVSDGLTGADVAGIPLIADSFRLDDNTGMVFNTALDLPTSLDLNDFSSSLFFLQFFASESNQLYSVVGTLETLELQQPGVVPEPSSFILASIGVVALGFVGVRRRRNHLAKSAK